MLVVDGVKLLLLDELHQMRELKGGHALRLQQASKGLDEIVDVRHMGQHVVGRHQIGAFPLLHKTRGQIQIEEPLDRLDSLLTGRGRCASRGLHPQTGNAHSFEELQQIAVVGSDFDHMTARTEAQAFLHLRGIPVRMLQPGRRERAEIGIFVVE